MFERLELLIGNDKLKKLQQSSVLVVGIGGVGSYVVESLVRSSIGHLTLIDYDTIDISNLNRQLMTDTTNIGQYKTEVMQDRIMRINPGCEVTIINKKLVEDDILDIIKDKDYVVDACDDFNIKLALIIKCHEKGIRLISCMGMGNKVDPSKICICDISKTTCDPLAKSLRHALRDTSIKHTTVVSSTEVPMHSKILGSTSFVPSTAGLLIASHVVCEIGDIHAKK